MVVANEGNGTSPGSVSIVDISLCSASSLPTNPNCDPTNPIDATTFGHVVATVPVGINPIMVSVLSDYYAGVCGQCGSRPALRAGWRWRGFDHMHHFGGEPDLQHGDGDDPDQRASCLYCDIEWRRRPARCTWCATTRR
jgi:hypothetical protein